MDLHLLNGVGVGFRQRTRCQQRKQVVSFGRVFSDAPRPIEAGGGGQDLFADSEAAITAANVTH
jgi:hypothetical protein